MLEELDVLAIGAHPDDVELGCAGTLLGFREQELGVGVLDLTRGELGSRGTPEQRLAEAAEAARLLDVVRLDNFGLPDGDIPVDAETRLRLIKVLRACRPRLVITHGAWGHPDHFQVQRLVREACHHAGLARIDTGQPRHRPDKLAFWLEYTQPTTPQVVIDITAHWPRKERTLKIYASQLHAPGSAEPQTYLSRPDFLEQVFSFHRHMGNLTGCDLGEGFLLSRPARPPDLLKC